MPDCIWNVYWNFNGIHHYYTMKKLITLALIAGLLTSCGEQTTSEATVEPIGRLVTLYGRYIPNRASTTSYSIADYTIHHNGVLEATTTDGETIVTSVYTIHLY